MKTYLHGVLILIGAMIVNWLAATLKMPNWYSFFQGTSVSSFFNQAIHLPFISALWLLVGYPLALGLVAKLANSIIDKK